MGASESVAHRSGGRGGAERGAEPPAGEMGGAGCRCGAAGHGPGGVRTHEWRLELAISQGGDRLFDGERSRVPDRVILAGS